jgi:DNA repair protein RadA/Sms
MAKAKSYYFCQECGYQSSSWLGRCPECGKFGTFVEEVVKATQTTKHSSTQPLGHSSTPQRIQEVKYSETKRLPTHCAEFDRVLGGGIVPGSLLLLGGEPGIGKSTLLLQTALSIHDRKLLYVSGEESEQQIKMRADRLSGEGRVGENELYVVSETVTQRIFEHIDAVQPDLLIVDSIQTITTEDVESPAGSVSQIRQCTTEFQHYAKTTGVPVLLIGHITKDGTLAGPKVMEHIVDAVLQFEGDRNYGYRILRALKNRFGSTAEIGIFEMQGNGLREVPNPSEFLLGQRDETLSGAAVAATLEGVRPMFIEVQSLVSSAVYGTPQRNANGFDMRRLSMLLAVLEKRCGFKLGTKDVFLNIAGGIRVNDPAIDLAVACSILSSNVDIPISPRIAFAAELGLSGEVRPVSRVEQRIAEADRLGFEKIFISKYNLKEIDQRRYHIEIVPVSVIEEAFRGLFA